MKVLFVIAATLIGFFAGIFYGIAMVPKGSGLVGPAIVLMDGLIGAMILLVTSLWINGKLNADWRKKITVGLLLINLFPAGWMAHKFYTNRSDKNNVKELTPPPKKQTVPVKLMQGKATSKLGIGVVSPDFFSKKVLYFYSPNLEKPASDHAPYDSLVFAQTDHHSYSISYAPPWFYPEHMKMDYEILILKVLAISRDWVQVEVNSQTGLTSWLDATDLHIAHWADFLLHANSVEIIDKEKNPLRTRPLSYGGVYEGPAHEYMLPLVVNENWMKVSLVDGTLKKVGEAWLQWHDMDQLLIRYNLLS